MEQRPDTTSPTARPRRSVFNTANEPHPIHHTLGPVVVTIATLLMAGGSILYLRQHLSGETASWATIVSVLFFPFFLGTVYVLTFLLHRAFGRYHAIATVTVSIISVVFVCVWTMLWVRIYNANPIHKLQQTVDQARTIHDCVRTESDLGYWHDCVQKTLHTDQDFTSCLGQANEFIRPLNDDQASSVVCGLIFAQAKHDPAICDRLSFLTDQAACHSQYDTAMNR